MRKSILLLITVVAAINSYAQSFSNKGKDFWVGYGYHQVMNNGNGQQMVLYFATDQVTNITISIPGIGYTQNLVSGATPTVLTSNPIPKIGAQDARLLTASTAPEDKGIHITSDKPMVAYAHIYNQNVSGASILFPTNTLGKEYYSINYKNTSNADNSNCWFYVVATDPGTTTVEITPSADAIGHPANVPFTVNLNQGQIYNVMGELTSSSNPFTGSDLTGSKIKSIPSATGGCKRIAVYSGSGRISITCGNNSSSSDNYMVQAFPKDAWGKKYLTVPTSSLNNNVFRIGVSDPATQVLVNGAPIAVPLINNFYYELPQTTLPQKIEADLPIIVSQYIASQGGCGNPPQNTNPGDPEVIYLSPVEQNIAKVLWNATPNFNIIEHYYNVVIPNTGTAISSFRLDGAPVSPALFTVHPQDPGFSYLSRRLTASGVHTIESDSGFNAIAYGFGTAESYGYNAGTNIKDLYNFIAPINPFSISPDPVACTGTPFFLTITFPFIPTSLNFNFGGFQPAESYPNQAAVDGIFESTYFIGAKQVWRYKIPHTFTYTPANSSPGYPVNVVAGTTSSDGCGNTFERDFDLAVYDPPIAKMDWFNNGCVTDSVRFRDTTTYLAGTYSYKWYWDFGDGVKDSVRYPVHLYANPGTYTVKFAMISNVGCFSDTAVKTITVTRVPVADFNTSSPICMGSSISFTSTSSAAPPGNLQKWYWDFGDGNTQTITLPASSNTTHTYTAWGNRTPKLRVETNSGCQSLLDSLPLYVAPVPVANFVLPGGLCLPSDTANFVNSSTVADGNTAGLTYLWNFGDPGSGVNNTSTIKNPEHYYISGGPFSISLEVTSAQGCVHDTTKVLSTVYPQPVAAFTVAPENCFNIATSFSSQSSGSGQPITNWYWDFGDGTAIGSGVNTTHTYAAPGTYTIKHWVKTSTGCYSDTLPQTITINPLPTVNFSSTAPACENKTISFTDLSTPNAGTLQTWLWNFDDPTSGALNTASINNPQHTFSAAGTYSVSLIVTTTKGCVDTVIIDKTINSKPVAGYINPEVCLSDTYAQFTDTSSVEGGSITAWLWNFDDPISGALNTSALQNPQHSYSTIGTKNVTLIVTSNSGCTDTTTQSFFVNGDIPVANFTVFNENALCANDSVSIQNTSTVNVGSVVKVEIYWDNLGAPGTFETDDFPVPGKVYNHLYPNFQSPLTKTYEIRFRAYSGATCIHDKLYTITINAAPRVRFTAIPDTCLNIAPFQIVQASEIGGVPGSFVFTGPGVSSTGIFDPSLVGPGTYTIKYVYTSNMGCMDSAQRQIRILAPPVANFGFSIPTCETKNVRFTDSCSAPVGTITTWTWDFADGTPLVVRNTNTQFTHVFANAGTYPVKLIVTTDDGCNSIVKIKDVLVNPQPLASFTFTDTACLPNAQIAFNNTSSIADGTENTFRYLWDFGDPGSGLNNASTALNPTHIYTAVGPYAVKLRVTSGAGCVDDTLIQLNTIHPQPKADMRFSKPSVCLGDNVQFIDQSDPKDGSATEWYWDFGDNGNATNQSPFHTYADIGTYPIQLYMVNSFGCNSDTITESFSVYPYPVVNAGPDQLVLEGENTILQATATGDDMVYVWTESTYLNNSSILRPTCTPVNDITYTLTVTGRGGCPVADQVKVVVLKTPRIPNTFSPNNDGINDLWDIQYLKTYPTARVQVFTRTGQLVFESRGYREPWNGTKNGKPLPMDTYYYIIEPESGRAPVTGFVTIIR